MSYETRHDEREAAKGRFAQEILKHSAADAWQRTLNFFRERTGT
jgi:hypothetical protein